MKGPGDVYSRLPKGLCRARKRHRFDFLVCVHWAGHRGHHSFVDPWTLVMQHEDSNFTKFPLKGSSPCAGWQRRAVDLGLWVSRYCPVAFWGWRFLAAIYCLFCVGVKTLENDLNHPHWKEWKGSPGSGHGPLCAKLCCLTDFLTGGRCHD